MKDGLFGISSVFLGALAAGLSIVIVLGSMLLAFTEGGQTTSFASFPTLESVDISTPSNQGTAPPANTPTINPTPIPTNQPTLTPTLILSALTESDLCEPPPGWEAYTVQRSDTLNKLSASTGLTPQQLADANCLTESRLIPGTILYLPPTSPTITPLKCGAPSHWVIYIVRSGDTLFSIAQRVNSTVSQLKYANCLTSDKIRTGQKILVPYQPAPISSPTPVSPTKQPPSPTSTLLPTATPTDGNISIRPPPYPYPPP
ncbi:MAG: LysM peptidoglycan-binding domain-containing protein [Chloroflexi bacterium]|nr:LysM peptidoglycan-binding domain-containing protein [Chloroflexota bacterium]